MASRADVTAGQPAQVQVPGQRTRQSALDTCAPANESAAVSPMGEGAAHRDPRPGLEGTRVPGTGQGAARLPETGGEMVTRTRVSRCRQLGATGMNNLP